MEDDHDSDVGDLLDNLLGNDEEAEESPPPPTKVLKELDFNFLDDVDQSTDKIPKDQPVSLIHDCDSSDDEDKKYFETARYSESGKDIKDLIKKQEFDKSENSSKYFAPTTKNVSNSASSSLEAKIKSNTIPKSPKTTPMDKKKAEKTTGPLTAWLNKPADVYTDPVFGLRINKPLISSTELKERMKDRKAVTVTKVKNFISSHNLDEDWAIAGVLIQKSTTRKSQNGNAYCIWTVSDLSLEINTVSIFLFKQAYKQFWKTSEGTVIGILNPNVMESRQDRHQATLSVDVAQKIMILGNSRDMGKCKSVKANGDPCTNIVNIAKCEYCTYHVKSEYNKASRRQDLQTDKNNRRFGNSFGSQPKNSAPGIYNQGHHQNRLAIPAKRNMKYEQKDLERLAMLRGETVSEKESNDNSKTLAKPKTSTIDHKTIQTTTNGDRLSKIRSWSSPQSTISVLTSIKPTSIQAEPSTPPSALKIPRLGFGLKGSTVDFNEPITPKQKNSAKLNAIKWVQKNGGLKQSNPNKIRESKEKIEAGAKRRREDDEKEEIEPKAKKITAVSDKFKELLEVKSRHTDLIEKADDNEKEKYFNKLETKERMEEKMLNTFKIDCKAVKCLICKYTSFSASDMCKEKRHPLRVIDAVKSFFKCSDCGNRTVSLDRIPSISCKKCSGSNWVRTSMMAEKKTSIGVENLSIRGGEEKFIGSDIKDHGLNLLVPDEEN